MMRTLALFVFISAITLLATDGCAKRVRYNFWRPLRLQLTTVDQPLFQVSNFPIITRQVNVTPIVDICTSALG